MMIDNMQQLQQLTREGFTDWDDNVKVTYQDGMALFTYTPGAQFEGKWTWFERVSRGLILDAETGEVLARPFDKFFNWGERGHKSSGYLVTVTEKIDGSLGILYRRDGFKVATRGSFDSEQANFATDWLQNVDLSDLPDELTLLFEIVYPGNRIVVDYGGLEGLYLLAARNRFTGEYLPMYPDVFDLQQKYGFFAPQVYSFNSVTDILAATDNLDGNSEGWVAEFSDGQRFKFKGDRYLELHRIVTNTSFKRVLTSVQNGTYNAMVIGVPDEFLGQIRAWKAEIDESVKKVSEDVESAFKDAPQGDRKTFALWAKENHKDLMGYLFYRLDGRDYTELIYRQLSKNLTEVEAAKERTKDV